VLLLFVWVSERNAVAEDALVTRTMRFFSTADTISRRRSPVRKDGHTVFERGYGVPNSLASQESMSKRIFAWPPAPKQFTAMSIMLLVHDGNSHDDKLTDVFPDFPAYGKAITIRNLLNHTSGLHDYEDLVAAAEKRNGARSGLLRVRFKTLKC